MTRKLTNAFLFKAIRNDQDLSEQSKNNYEQRLQHLSDMRLTPLADLLADPPPP